jgi:heme-degrading monooxygenase HmoA
MFIAMNRFKVQKGSVDAFEQAWIARESYLDQLPGFVEFHLLRGPEHEDHTLFSSHTVWATKQAFENWTQSDQFRKSHSRATSSTTGPLYIGHPHFEGFEVRQHITNATKAA